ncbi:unnamed protein product [Hyaloperonospora brassicae]|uniref:Glycosyltransferase 2-like domain-containing protein n=1 Tax=Hyaloperonospora brassicae TaxID=162125 RepID=A0AAV0TN89_HYABA|nr:unnamed protein product [Hyaloperonospora brassicae]
MNNRLLNEGADGTYVLSLDNDMKPHLKFLLAVLSLVFSEGEAIDDYSRGRDGFDSADFAGSNAVFRRQAFDSIGGSQTNTLYSFLPPLAFCRWVLILLANRAVDNNYKKRAQAGMVFVVVHFDDGSFEAIQARVTGMHKS